MFTESIISYLKSINLERDPLAYYKQTSSTLMIYIYSKIPSSIGILVHNVFYNITTYRTFICGMICSITKTTRFLFFLLILMILFTGYHVFFSYVVIFLLLNSIDVFWGGSVRLFILLSFIVVNKF